MNNQNRSWITRLAGYTIILAAITGLVLAAWGLTSLWRIKGPFTERAAADLALLQTTLTTTQDGLAAANTALEQAEGSVDALVNTLAAVAKSLQDTTPVLESIGAIVDTDLPATILNTRQSILSAQTSARLIDDILGSVSAIPLLGLNRYAPQVPLNVALARVADDLGELPLTLSSMETGLAATRRNAILLEIQIRDIAFQVDVVKVSLSDARQVISSYETVLTELSDRTVYIEENLTRWVNSTVTILTIVLLWLAITQLGLITQGLALIRSAPPAAPPEISNTPTAEEK